MRAECCRACLERACSVNSSEREACMGCDATHELVGLLAPPKSKDDEQSATSEQPATMEPPDTAEPRGPTMPQVDVTTVLAESAEADAFILHVENRTGFSPGDVIEVSSINASETCTIKNFSEFLDVHTILLVSTLQHCYQ